MSEIHEQLVASYPWITADFLQNILRKEIDACTVSSFHLKNALGKAENFASHMISTLIVFRRDTDTHEECIELLIKASLSNAIEAQFVDSVFCKEVKVYQEIVPAVEQLLREHNDQCQISAK